MLFGSFDILHLGHENLFKQARKKGDYLIVCLARDCTIEKIKGRKPVFNERQRLFNLKKTSWADKVVLGDKKDYFKKIRKEKPDIFCLGYDQVYFIKGLKEKIKKLNLRVKIIRLKPYREKIYKSSKIRKKLYAGH